MQLINTFSRRKRGGGTFLCRRFLKIIFVKNYEDIVGIPFTFHLDTPAYFLQGNFHRNIETGMHNITTDTKMI